MPADQEKARARARRYREKAKIAKHGPEAAGKDLRGKHGHHAKGASHYKWNNDRIIASNGYVRVRVGVGHPLADPNGYAYEHLVVWASSGRPLPKENEVIHHINEVKTDNRIENLQLTTRAEHNAHHIAEHERDELGRIKPKAAGSLLDGVEHKAFPEVARG